MNYDTPFYQLHPEWAEFAPWTGPIDAPASPDIKDRSVYGTHNEIALFAKKSVGLPVEPVAGMRTDIAVGKDVLTAPDHKPLAQAVAFVLETACIHFIEICKGTDINSIVRVAYDVASGTPGRPWSSCRMT